MQNALNWTWLLLLAIAACSSGRTKAEQKAEKKDGAIANMAFVLLTEPRLPDPDSLARAFASFEPALGKPRVELSKTDSKGDEALIVDLGSKGTVMVGLMPVAVPKGEAEAHVPYSISAVGSGWKLTSHGAHLIVVLSGDRRPPIEALSLFTSAVAAVVQSTPAAVGVYWGDSGATHEAKFFLSAARERRAASRMFLWSGFSVARESDGRTSLLSLGMKQLGLPDLLMVLPREPDDDSIDTFFSFLTYVAERGQPIPEGDTVGRSETERLPVRYVSSPIDPKQKVWRVELPRNAHDPRAQ